MVVVVQLRVLRDRELEDEPSTLSVLRNVAEACVEHLAGTGVVYLLAADLDLAAFRPAQARDRLDELALSVSVDAGDPDDLSGAHVEGHAANGRQVTVVHDVEVLDLEQDVPRLGRRLLDPEEHVPADHHPRQLLLCGALARNGVDLLAPAQDRDPVSDLEHLVQLVRDEDD